MRFRFVFLVALLISSNILHSQNKQSVRGQIIDSDTKFALIGVNITIVLPDSNVLGASTDLEGYYRIKDVPVGRHNVLFSYLGYKEEYLNNVVLSSGKELILNVELNEDAISLQAVTVVARRNGEVLNEMAVVSSREFSVEETNRYAGSRGEPARMAANFAGVQGADDSRNDIIIRGNSPQGVLWRLDGVSIPNPNHFAIPGTGGGPVTILNNKFLANSDFYTGAFPAEFANGTAGVFDLRMRNGNNEQHEFSAQLGFLGTELTAEGPINKSNRSSYLVMYRYSTIQLFDFLGINVGTDALPKYQDAAFRFNFPSKNGANIAFFGIAGKSKIDIVLSEKSAPDTTTLIFGSNDRDQYFASQTGVLGLSYSKPLNKSTYIKSTLSVSHQKVDVNHDLFFRHVEDARYVVDSIHPLLAYVFEENKVSLNTKLTRKINSRTVLKIGLNIDTYLSNYLDSARIYHTSNNEWADWRTRWDAQSTNILIQPFAQIKYDFNDKLSGTVGMTALYFSINNNSLSPIEPRLGIAYQINDTQKFSVGAGYHSQIQPLYLYYYGESSIANDPQEQNLEIGLNKSAHLVASYQHSIGRGMKLKIETYFQYLHNIPTDSVPGAFSLVNAGSGFSRFFPGKLINTSKAKNYGIEFTLEKYFSKGYYFLITSSLFDAKYLASDTIWRNTTFNGSYAANLLFAKEFKLTKKASLHLGGKFTSIGGRRYGIVDKIKSAKQSEIIFQNEGYNSKQFKPYYRLDIKINYIINSRNLTHEFAVDLINVFQTKNILSLTYAPDHPSGNPIREEYQLGFLPIFYYKLDF